MSTYLVVAIYREDDQRFAEDYEAATPDEAEKMALEDHPGLIIAGVIDKDGRVVA